MKRRDVISRLWRKSPESFVTTLDGNTVYKYHWCKSCQKNYPIMNFYIQSKSRSKYDGHVRDVCIPCWDTNNGKIHKVGNDSNSNLIDFMT